MTDEERDELIRRMSFDTWDGFRVVLAVQGEKYTKAGLDQVTQISVALLATADLVQMVLGAAHKRGCLDDGAALLRKYIEAAVEAVKDPSDFKAQVRRSQFEIIPGDKPDSEIPA